MEPIRLTKRWSEPPPGATFRFRMIKTVSIAAELAFGERSLSLFSLGVATHTLHLPTRTSSLRSPRLSSFSLDDFGAR